LTHHVGLILAAAAAAATTSNPTSRCSNDSDKSHRRCHLLNDVQNIDDRQSKKLRVEKETIQATEEE